MTDLESRIARLEAESDIRRLKTRYLNACDAKDVGAIIDGTLAGDGVKAGWVAGQARSGLQSTSAHQR